MWMPFMYISLYVCTFNSQYISKNEEISFQSSQIENCPPYDRSFYNYLSKQAKSFPIKSYLKCKIYRFLKQLTLKCLWFPFFYYMMTWKSRAKIRVLSLTTSSIDRVKNYVLHRNFDIKNWFSYCFFTR